MNAFGVAWTAGTALLVAACLLAIYVHRQGTSNRWLRLAVGPRPGRRWLRPGDFYAAWLAKSLAALFCLAVRHIGHVPARLSGILVTVHVSLIVLLTFNLLDEQWLERRGELYTERPPQPNPHSPPGSPIDSSDPTAPRPRR